jgi:integrase
MGTTLDRQSVSALALPDGKTDFTYWDATLKGFGVRLRIGADGKLFRRFLVMYRVGGRQRMLIIKDPPGKNLTADAARKIATTMLGKAHEGIDPAAEKDTARAESAIRLRSVVIQYLAHMERQLENDKRRPVTFKNAQLYLQRGDYFKALWSKPINAVSRADVATALNRIAADRTATTASAARKFLSAFFVWSMKEGIADANPVIGTNDPGSNPARERVLKDKELAAIWKACKDDEYGKVIKLLMLTACRSNEIGDLCWSWLDDDLTTMTIPKEVAKNHRAHTLPITGMMRSIIEAQNRMVDRDYVFGQRGKGFTMWQQCKAKFGNGIKKPWQLRDIRRSVATGMADIGIQPHVIEAVLNHVSGHKAGVAGIYNRSTYAREMKNALSVWSDHIASIISGGERKVVAFPQPA